MAKRARGSTTRPGQRAPLARTTRPVTLTREEETRAAELEAAIVAQERAAETAAKTARTRSQRADDIPVATGGTIAARAAHEYAYVARDIKRIAVIAAVLLVTLFVLFVVITAMGIGPF